MRYALDLDAMLEKCDRLQWSVDEIDWESPGAAAVDADQRLGLAGFMTDLLWIEAIAAAVFAHMSEATGDPPLRAIFASFAVDEQRHADAELLLMRRWGIAGPREVPAPNPSARNLVRAIDRVGHRVHPAVYSAIIPFTELVLDGALVKHLDTHVADPVCREVFRRINADEARHLAVDFYMLERHGGDSRVRTAAHGVRAAIHPVVLHALLLGYLPLLRRVQPNIRRIGLDLGEVRACIRRYTALGKHSPAAARHPIYALFRRLARGIESGDDPLGELLLRLSEVCDALGLGLRPSRGAAA
jgi:hypothetical protein